MGVCTCGRVRWLCVGARVPFRVHGGVEEERTRLEKVGEGGAE